jgi:alpha-amylase/alpha-mannosidase (GH57 family)
MKVINKSFKIFSYSLEKINLCIHGHYYQPPRENPKTGEIDSQPSAAPFHDWNERIYQECYKPNTEAIIINNSGEVINRVNNYENMNFNFGPTLLNWIKSKHPKTLNKIIEADKKSILKHNGHGNAIAQAYNHIILPLANYRDKITQIKWGLKHFKHFFGRDSEGIWLPETACNPETLRVVADEGVKYVILDPLQAEKIRKLNSFESWRDVSASSINPKIPYRCFTDATKNNYVDIFFYDGPFARSIAFEDVIFSADKMMQKIEQIKLNAFDNNQLISIATDGETYGHHKHFTERTLAYLLTVLAPSRGIKVVNYGEYLSENPPEHEVVIKDGKGGDGTAWSCVHGTGRWKEDCGCNTGGEINWNQKWRTPLRDSLNYLRDELSVVYEKYGSVYFKNVWEARNDYIHLFLDGSEKNKEIFFEKHSKNGLLADEKKISLDLLEMQKFAMFMFTSCGWFFSDISGIETVQILEYARRAIEITESISGNTNIEQEFLKILENAKSNKPEYGNGKQIYLDYVLKSRETAVKKYKQNLHKGNEL